MEALAVALEASALGGFARGSAWAYPAANLLHLMGLVLLLGSIGLLDLRIAGLFRSLPLAPLARILRPFGVAGLVALLVGGAVMFAADAGPLVGSSLFRWKMLLVAIALANALLFNFLWRQEMEAPASLRVMAIVSLSLWLLVAALGRLIAYL